MGASNTFVFPLAFHDPSTGFHDIKAIGYYSVDSSSTVAIAAATLIFALCLLACWYWLKRKRAVDNSTQEMISPSELATKELNQLETLRSREEIAVRDLSESLSQTIRRFLETQLRFPALESTPKEVDQHLQKILATRLPLISENRGQEMRIKIKETLSFCQAICFGPHSEEFLNAKDVRFDTALEEARSIIREVSRACAQEEERTRSVVAAHARQDYVQNANSGAGA